MYPKENSYLARYFKDGSLDYIFKLIKYESNEWVYTNSDGLRYKLAHCRTVFRNGKITNEHNIKWHIYNDEDTKKSNVLTVNHPISEEEFTDIAMVSMI